MYKKYTPEMKLVRVLKYKIAINYKLVIHLLYKVLHIIITYTVDILIFILNPISRNSFHVNLSETWRHIVNNI